MGNDMGQSRESAGAIFDAAFELPEGQRAAFLERGLRRRCSVAPARGGPVARP